MLKTLAEKDEKIIIQNLKAATSGMCIVKNIEDYWKAFNNPESEKRVRIASQDFFSKPMTLFVSNEISGGRGNMSQKLNWTVEINLHAQDGSIIYQKQEANNMAIAVTANSLFFAIYMKSGEIKIYDTNIGSLIVPYYQKSNLVFLSSYSNGNLAFIDLEGKITVINIIKKMAVFENKDSVKSLLLNLNNKLALNTVDAEESKDEEAAEFYLKSFYLNDWFIYIDVSNTLSNCTQTYCLNNQLGTWEKITTISASIITDSKAGNIAHVKIKDDNDMSDAIEQPGFGISLETVDKDLFKLEKSKQSLIDEIGLAMSKMEKKNHSKVQQDETLDEMEERIMLYERLEHKYGFLFLFV